MTRILVADDEVDIVELISRLLKRQGFEVLVAYDGSEAIEMARLHHPDLVLLDVQMPAAIAFSVLNDLKTSPKTADIPVIVISGFDTTENKLAATKAGANDFIPKPFSLKHLLTKVRNNLMDSE